MAAEQATKIESIVNFLVISFIFSWSFVFLKPCNVYIFFHFFFSLTINIINYSAISIKLSKSLPMGELNILIAVTLPLEDSPPASSLLM